MESDNYMTACKAAPGGGREREEPGARGSVRVGRGEGRGRGLEARTWGGRGGPPASTAHRAGPELFILSIRVGIPCYLIVVSGERCGG